MLQPQSELDLADLRNDPTHKRDRPWTVRLAWVVWDVWHKASEMGAGLSHAWASIHQLRRDVEDLRHENAALRDRLNVLEAQTAHLRLYEEVA